jgi:hypothetical protein
MSNEIDQNYYVVQSANERSSMHDMVEKGKQDNYVLIDLSNMY